MDMASTDQVIKNMADQHRQKKEMAIDKLIEDMAKQQ